MNCSRCTEKQEYECVKNENKSAFVFHCAYAATVL